MWNRHRESEKDETLTTFLVQVWNFYLPLSLRFFDMRRERHNLFLCWLFHLTPPCVAPRRKLLVWPRRAPKIDLPKSQLTAFFKSQNPQPISSRHDVIPIPNPISYLGFLLWHLWLSHPPHVHINTCTQCVHLTNLCTKPKVSQPKGKIYIMKNDNIKKNPSAII